VSSVRRVVGEARAPAGRGLGQGRGLNGVGSDGWQGEQQAARPWRDGTKACGLELGTTRTAELYGLGGIGGARTGPARTARGRSLASLPMKLTDV